jgi:predicted RNase H-like HicB family nuclease
MRQVRYPIIIEKGPTSYGAYSPDLPGCVAAGESIEEVKELMKQAIALHLQGMLEDGDPLPEPSATEWVDIALAS